jgi:hypothetical protein
MNYFRKVYVALLALAVSFSFSSCGSDDDDNGPVTNVTLEVSMSPEIFNFAGEDRKVTVTTTGDWAVSTDQPAWIKFDPMRGSGNGEFTVKVEGHQGDNERTATVTVKIDDTDIKKEITITQDKVQAAWEKNIEGIFEELIVGVHFFWDDPATPAMYFRHDVLKPGTFTTNFPLNSYIHTMLLNKEPGYFEYQGGGLADPKFSASIVDRDPTITNAYDAVVQFEGIDVKEDGTIRNGTGDIHALCPRITPQLFSFHLPVGTFWTVHTLELDVTDATCGTSAEENNGSFPIDTEVKLKFTFEPDEE